MPARGPGGWLTSDADGVRVLILTTFGLDDSVYEALRAGAKGFVLKDAPPEELLAAIEVVARGRRADRACRHAVGHRGIRAALSVADAAPAGPRRAHGP